MPCAFPIKSEEQKLFLNILRNLVWECRIHDFMKKRYVKLNNPKSTQCNPTGYNKRRWYQDQQHFHGPTENTLNSVRFFFFHIWKSILDQALNVSTYTVLTYITFHTQTSSEPNRTEVLMPGQGNAALIV